MLLLATTESALRPNVGLESSDFEPDSVAEPVVGGTASCLEDVGVGMRRD